MMMLSVKEFGATGDGVTDDTAAIQAAINSLTAGGIVYLPGATYIVSSTLNIPVSNVKMMGSGNATVIKAADSSNYVVMILANALNGIVISDLVVDANHANRAGLTNRTVGIELRSCVDSTVENCISQNMIGAPGTPGVGIGISGLSNRCKVTSCILKDCGIDGKAADGIYSSGIQTLIINCIAINCKDTGFVIEKSNQSGIIGCTAKGCSAGAAITNSVPEDVTGNFIDGLTIYDWSASNTGGIQIGTPRPSATGRLLNTRVSNVTMQRVSGKGPSLFVRRQGGQIQGLTLENIRIYGAGTQGILLTADDVLITNCHIYDATESAIHAFKICQRVIIQGNYLNGGSFGITLDDGCSDCHLTGNVIIGVTVRPNMASTALARKRTLTAS
jgi:hypothetical protein